MNNLDFGQFDCPDCDTSMMRLCAKHRELIDNQIKSEDPTYKTSLERHADHLARIKDLEEKVKVMSKKDFLQYLESTKEQP